MDFIKRHYEKMVLGLVLLILAVAVVYMLVEIPKEKAALKETTSIRTTLNSKPLPAPDTARIDAANARLEKPAPLNFSGPHNLFNPVAWQKQPDGRLSKKPAAGDAGPAAVLVAKVNPLYTTINYESPGAQENQFLISIEREAELKAVNRRKQSKYVTLNAKGDFGTLREVKGPADNPELSLELADTAAVVKIALGKPFKRVDGYSADLKYDPERKTWAARRIGDRIVLAGDEFTVAAINLVATNQFEVVLSARSTGKKTTIRFNGPM